MRWGTAAAVAAVALAAACAGPGPRAGSPAGPVVDMPAVAPEPPRVAPVVAPIVAPATPGDYPPSILLPDPAAPDAEVARVGELVLRKSHAYTRLLSAQPKLALSAVDLLVFDVLVSHHATQFGVTVLPSRVEELAATEERQVRDQVASEFGAGLEFADYVWRLFGMRLADWQALLRLRTAQRLYQGYVIRYLALREDRVEIRFLVHSDRAVAQEVSDKVKAGADFATLALRWSEDPSRRDGGRLPAFSHGFQHPCAAVAFTLQRGEVSAPFQARWGDAERWFVVYCLDRLAGRDVPFAEVRDEIDRDLEARPLQQIETAAYTLRWRGELERAPASNAVPVHR